MKLLLLVIVHLMGTGIVVMAARKKSLGLWIAAVGAVGWQVGQLLFAHFLLGQALAGHPVPMP